MLKVRFAVAALAALSFPSFALADDPPDPGDGSGSDYGSGSDPGSGSGSGYEEPPPTCGDWYVSGAEICDSGPYNGMPYNCNADCSGWTAWCGDGQTSGDEVCDEGGWNGQPGHCDASCTGQAAAVCGDGYASGDEQCDDGMANGMPYYCNATCTGPTAWCGDGQTGDGEVCDDGWQNGEEGYCNATCTGIIARTPFTDAATAPELQALSYGRVLGNRAYEVSFALGEVGGVGLAPGFGVGLRVRTGTGPGRCGLACDVPLSSVSHDGSALVLDDGGTIRRFAADGAGWREVAPAIGVAFTPATATASGAGIDLREPGGSLTRSFDGSGRETARSTPWGAVTLGYDGSGRLIGATNAAGATLALAYDGEGRLSTVTDPTGFTMTLRYGGDGHLISLEGPPDGAVTPNLGFGWWGDDLTSVGRLGFNPIAISYDRGLVSFARDVDGTAYAFQSNGSELGVIDSSMQYRKLTFDGDRLARIETNAGSRIDYGYDALGRLTETRVATAGADLVSHVTYDAANRITATTDPEGRTATTTYDAAGNVAATTDPDGHTTTFTRDAAGRVIAITDPLGRVTTTTYDANGLPLSTTAGGITTSRTYDARGLVASSTDAYGVTTTFTRDARGEVTAVNRPGAPAITIARTATGGGEQVVVSRGGETSTTVTDRYGRVTASSSSLGPAQTITYDQVTGLPSATSSTFRSATQTTQTTYTNTGDAAGVWVNGQQRQSAARTVPPGNAWFQP